MNTKYNQTISDKLTADYINILINKVFALLPMFEESTESDEKNNLFKIYQRNLLQTINGNINFIKYDNVLILEILSHLEALVNTAEHDDYKRHVLKICKLLTLVRKEVENNGV